MGGVSDKSCGPGRGERFESEGGVPLLDFVEALEERNGDEDDDGLLAVADLDLFVIWC